MNINYVKKKGFKENYVVFYTQKYFFSASLTCNPWNPSANVGEVLL